MDRDHDPRIETNEDMDLIHITGTFQEGTYRRWVGTGIHRHTYSLVESGFKRQVSRLTRISVARLLQNLHFYGEIFHQNTHKGLLDEQRDRCETKTPISLRALRHCDN